MGIGQYNASERQTKAIANCHVSGRTHQKRMVLSHDPVRSRFIAGTKKQCLKHEQERDHMARCEKDMTLIACYSNNILGGLRYQLCTLSLPP